MVDPQDHVLQPFGLPSWYGDSLGLLLTLLAMLWLIRWLVMMHAAIYAQRLAAKQGLSV